MASAAILNCNISFINVNCHPQPRKPFASSKASFPKDLASTYFISFLLTNQFLQARSFFYILNITVFEGIIIAASLQFISVDIWSYQPIEKSPTSFSTKGKNTSCKDTKEFPNLAKNMISHFIPVFQTQNLSTNCLGFYK